MLARARQDGGEAAALFGLRAPVSTRGRSLWPGRVRVDKDMYCTVFYV
jgi:hypothetical protein